MGGSLVTVLILLVLDLVVCTPSLFRNRHRPPSIVAKNLGKDVKLDGKLNTENAEVITEVPVNLTVTDHKDDVQETSHDKNGYEEQMPGRSLKVGDTFTPQEMLPIAQSLLKKVGRPGEGKGIVSSESNPQVLADVLFENYFMTMKRIVTLKPNDISGLDALQALSLSGQKVKMAGDVSITAAPPTKIIGENNLNNSKIASKYKMLTKKMDLKFKPPGRRFSIREHADKTLAKKRKLIIKARRARSNQRLKTKKRVSKIRGQADKTLAKKRKLVIKARRARSNQRLKTKKRVSKIRGLADKTLAKKRKLALKAQRDQRNVNQKTKTRVPKRKKRVPKIKKRKPKTALKNTRDASHKNKVCRWRYVCTDPADQRTCHVYPDCITNDKNDKYIGERNDKNAKTLEKFRRMIKIDPIDEEVGKIVERHTLSLKAQAEDVLKIETLGEYFDKLMMMEAMKDTSYTKALRRRPKI